MSQTLTQINTPLNGAAGSNSNPFPGENGVPGGDATETFSNDSFTSNGVNEIAITPQANAGAGSIGVNGGNGTNGTETLIGQTEVYGPGETGQNSGDGGNSGTALIGLVNISAGTATTPSTTGVEINARAAGSTGGAGNAGGGGGSAGYNSSSTIGGQPGNGGNGGSGGLGGDATVAVSGFTSYDSASVGTDIFTSVQGGVGGVGFAAAGGGQGGLPSDGGTGGAGEKGGDATDSFTGSTVADNDAIFIQSTATGGQGEVGGGGGPAGAQLSVGPDSFDTYVYGMNGDGGAGGAGGNATATISSDNLTAPVMNINVFVGAGPGDTGGTSPSEATSLNSFTQVTGSPAGATGATGAEGAGLIVFTNNTITVGQGLNGTIPFNQPGAVTLDWSITDRALVSANVTEDLNGAAGGNLQFSGNSFIGGGQSTLNLELAGTGSIMIDTAAGTISIAGSGSNAISGFSTLDLDNNTTVLAGSGALTLNFASDPDTLIYTPTSGDVMINHATDANLQLDFQGFGTSLTEADLQNDTSVVAGNTFITLGDGQIELTGFTGPIPPGDETIHPECFRIGTRIATPDGAVAVEDLTVGGMVLTNEGDALPIRWIGRRHFDCRDHATPATVLPIRIAAHAFAENQPCRDLFLSPEHAIYAGGVLIPVKHLIDGIGVARVVTDEVTYFHIELPCHAIVLAEGLPAESYLDTSGSRFDRPLIARGVDTVLIWETQAAAPLCVTGPALDRVRQMLAARAVDGLMQLAA
jgi:collagen type I alpha